MQIHDKLGREREICVPWLKSTSKNMFEKNSLEYILFSIVVQAPEESDGSAWYVGNIFIKIIWKLQARAGKSYKDGLF